MRQALLLPAALLLAITLLAPPTLAQETTGRIEGRVLDAQGRPIADVSVTVTSPALQGGRGRLTSARGTFVLLGLSVGEYRVKLQHLAYQAQVLEEVRVRLGQTTSLGDIRLGDRVLDQPEIVVKSERALIDPTSTDVGGVLAARDFEPLPVERDYRSAATLLPQVNASFLGDPLNIAGATGQDNRYYMDGVDGTDPQNGTNGASLPYNFVKEVEVRTNGYQAEYRGALGGTVNAITYSGGNATQVRTFGFYTQNRPAADPRYAYKPDKGDYALYDVGFGVGGPIRRDALWYFVAYNPTITREDVEIAGLGMYPDHTTSHNLAAKLTWRANDRNTAVLTAVGDPTVREGVGAYWGVFGTPTTVVNPDVMLTDIHTGRFSIAAEGHSLLSRDFSLRSGLSWTRFLDRNWPSTQTGEDEFLFRDAATGAWSGGPPTRTDNRSTVLDANVTGTWFNGAHELKGGVAYRDIAWDFHLESVILTRNADDSYDQMELRGAGQVGNRIPSAFVQDSWRLGHGLRLNAGLRWDGLYIVGSDGQVAQAILDQWQPRVGIVWQPGGKATSKVTASAGRFYHDLSTWPVLWYYNANTYQAFIHFDHDPRVDPSGGVPWFEIIGGHIQQRIDGLKGQYFDGLAGTYEVQVTKRARLAASLEYRTLGEALEDGSDPVTGVYEFNNPGRGAMSAYPKAKHDYTALALSWQQRVGERSSLLASYVLSRNRGNYPGLFNSDFGYVNSNANGSFDYIQNLTNAYGLLPNDRTHVLKFVGHHEVVRGVRLGAVASWMSGTPLSEFGVYPGIIDPVFVRQRGTVDRSPAIWDLSLRVGYELPIAASSGVRSRVTLDLLHIGSQEKPVTYDQLHYRAGTTDWTFSDPSPTYLQPTQYQPGFAMRVGAEVEF